MTQPHVSHSGSIQTTLDGPAFSRSISVLPGAAGALGRRGEWILDLRTASWQLV